MSQTTSRDRPDEAEAAAPIDRRLVRIIRAKGDLAIWLGLAIFALALFDSQDVPRTFFYDEWSFVQDRDKGGFDGWLNPHNGHLTLLPRLLYRIQFAVFGLDHYHPYRLVGLLAHVCVATMVYLYARSRQSRLVGFVIGSVFLFLGSGWEVIFQPFAINFMGAAAAGILAWMAIDRQKRTGDTVASIALTVSLAIGGLGISMLIGAAARLAAQREWRRLVSVVAPPAALYAVWYLVYGQREGTVDNIPKVPRYVIDEAGSSVGGLAGRDILWGHLVLGILIVLAVIRIRGGGPRVVRAMAPVAAAIANWVLVAYARADLGYPTSSRYVYVGAMFILLMLADLVALRSRRATSTLVCVAGALSVWGNWHILHTGPSSMRENTTYARAELRAVEWASATVPFDYTPDPLRMPGVAAGPYLDAVADLGSAAATDGELALLPDEYRQAADRVSLEAGHLLVAADVALCAEPTVTPTDASGNADVAIDLTSTGATMSIAAAEAPVEVRLRRYAAAYPIDPLVVVPAGTTTTLTIPADTAPLQQWRLQLRSADVIERC